MAAKCKATYSLFLHTRTKFDTHKNEAYGWWRNKSYKHQSDYFPLFDDTLCANTYRFKTRAGAEKAIQRAIDMYGYVIAVSLHAVYIDGTTKEVDYVEVGASASERSHQTTSETISQNCAAENQPQKAGRTIFIPEYEKYDAKWQTELSKLVSDAFKCADEAYMKGGRDVVVTHVLYYLSRIFGKGYINSSCPFVVYDEFDGYVSMDFVESVVNGISLELERRFKDMQAD